MALWCVTSVELITDCAVSTLAELLASGDCKDLACSSANSYAHMVNNAIRKLNRDFAITRLAVALQRQIQ